MVSRGKLRTRFGARCGPDYEVQSPTNQGISMGYCFSGLVAYSVVVFLVAAVFIGLYSNCDESEKEIVNGEEHRMVVNKLNILTFDNSDLKEEGNHECEC